jgi:uncharacterized protein (TIGR03083 family)
MRCHVVGRAWCDRRVDIAEHIAFLEADGPRLAAAAERAGWDARVPGTDWDVRELVTHTGGVHRWAADIVANGRDRFDTDAGRAVGTGPRDDALLDWFRTGHAALVETLRAAAAGVECATFLPAPSPLAFWARRQAHETAVHRADAEAAGGDVTPFDAGFAQDGIAELLLGFAARRRKPADRTASIAVRASDGPAWRVTVGAEQVQAEQVSVDGNADLTVAGSSSELYLWLWNRPSAATVQGDTSVRDLWARQVRVRWS